MHKGRVVSSSQDQHRHLTPTDGLVDDEYKKPPSLIDVAQNLRYSDRPVEILAGNNNRGAVVVNQDGDRPLSVADLAGGREKSQPHNHYIEKDKPPSQGDFGQHKHSNNGQGSQDQHRHVTCILDDYEKPPTLTGVAQNLRYLEYQPMEFLDENDKRVVVKNQDDARPLSTTDLASGREKSRPYNHHEKDRLPSEGDFGQRDHNSNGHGFKDHHRHLTGPVDDHKKPTTLTVVAQNLRYSDQPVEFLAGNDNRGAVAMNQDGGRPLSMADLAGEREKSQPYGHQYEKDKPSSQRDFSQRNRSSSDQGRFQTTSTPNSYNNDHFDQFIPGCD
ncbi:hypothetical protein L6452_09729 [Arctium lappa]|uniref:Uncharacterized protein n=1 Tax=Arctium lappa TaxID=4217 RepID=A0ACB9DL98_ARCLA|nr:hypothetical protein L6452_09729 [Arctium lappa]